MQSGARFIARERGVIVLRGEGVQEPETAAFTGTFCELIQVHMPENSAEWLKFCAWFAGLPA